VAAVSLSGSSGGMGLLLLTFSDVGFIGPAAAALAQTESANPLPAWLVKHPGLTNAEKNVYAVYAMYRRSNVPPDPTLLALTGTPDEATLMARRARLLQVGALAPDPVVAGQLDAVETPPADLLYNPPRSA
jgi:hypothetical protein